MGKKTKVGKQRKDRFYQLAKETGYRSRASFKLIQLNRKFEFLQKSKVLVDLCAAPGGWLQVAQKFMPVQSIIIGVDLVPIKPIHNVITLQEDITTQKCRSLISKELKTWKVDVVLNDGAPNVGRSWIHDAFEQNRLTLSALQLASEFLLKGGWFITKVFRSKDYNSLMWVFKKLFQRVHATKPQASRNESAEIFVVCQNFIAPDKIDAKFFDPAYVFAELKEDEQKMTKADLFKPLLKAKKAKAEGYDDGNILLHKKVKCADFIRATDYIDLLGKGNEIVMDSEEIKNHPSTTTEILECIKDLKVLGRKELTLLMTWRKGIRNDLFKDEILDTKVGDIDVENEIHDVDKENNEIDETVEDPEEAELNEEAQKLKRKKRKIAKEKRKIEERLNLKMIIKNDQLVQEEQDLFNLKNIKKATQIAAIKDVAPTHHDTTEIESDLDLKPRQNKVFYDKDSTNYFDPDDSDAINDEENEDLPDLEQESDVESDGEDMEVENENGIIHDFVTKSDKVNEMTNRFFENKIFHRLDNSNLSDEGIDTDDLIALEELENHIPKVNGENGSTRDSLSFEADKNMKSTKTITFEESENSENSDSDDETDQNKNKIPITPFSPEEMSLATLMIKSKKNKRDLFDNGWNRYVHEDDELLPSWFRKDEQENYRKLTPVTNEMVQEYNAKIKEIKSKPIKKAMEAKARKKKRAIRRLEKARLKAENVTDEADMTNKEKAQYIRSIYKKALKKDKDKVQLVVGKKQYGNRRPPGVKGRYKVVDSRLKKDKRGKQQQTRNKKGKSVCFQIETKPLLLHYFCSLTVYFNIKKMSSTGNCNSINLKGSVEIICQFFNYALNNILFQRGLYPSDTFSPVQNYGLTIFMTTDDKLKDYLSAIFSQLKVFLMKRSVHRLVMVIINTDTNETIERWEFTVECNDNVGDDESVPVDIKEIQQGITSIIRQITASVTYLPLIDGSVTFDILLFTNKDAELPSKEWADSHSHLIPNAQEVKLRSLNTKVHHLKAAVAYKTN
ncbi:pre-rRNA processing protein ftsj3 [Blomia tropicalis]|nr:pre-rRNA processing protein ftsj3 [Blomia tropicalis]